MEGYDALIIGGGLFGCYSALYLASRGMRVVLLEKEDRLFQKASLVNQARLHGGYHYPRSIATAALSDEHKARFTQDHQRFVNFSFEKYYAIDRFGSLTDPLQFERFCAYLDIPCKKIEAHPLFNFDRLEALYLTEEYSFDPVLLREYYVEQVENANQITVFKGVQIQEVFTEQHSWKVSFLQKNIKKNLTATIAINASYAGTNAVNQLFGVRDLNLTHEISEIAFITSPQFAERGLTVMDGPFGSIMPYGRSGLLSLSSVAYTHHKISYENRPVFDCMIPGDDACSPHAPGNCTICPRRPKSSAYKMLCQMQQYFSEAVSFEYLLSYFTIKSKLKASYIDDGRPTEIALLHKAPKFYCLFAGKVNSIYEVEKIL